MVTANKPVTNASGPPAASSKAKLPSPPAKPAPSVPACQPASATATPPPSTKTMVLAKQGQTYGTTVQTPTGAAVTLLWQLPSGNVHGTQGGNPVPVNVGTAANWLGGNGSPLGAHLCHTYNAQGQHLGTVAVQYVRTAGTKATPVMGWVARPYVASPSHAAYNAASPNGIGHAQVITVANIVAGA